MMIEEVQPSDINLEDEDVLEMKQEAEGRALPKKPTKDSQGDTRMMSTLAECLEQPKIIVCDGREKRLNQRPLRLRSKMSVTH